MSFARSTEAAKKYCGLFMRRDMNKKYLARVDGVFPELVVNSVEILISEITCTEPLDRLMPAMGLMWVAPDGKPSKTTFNRLWTDGTQSVVSCQPHTGRTHQIRVHLQWLGYPIHNDYIYNSPAFGVNKGKNSDFGMTRDELFKSLSSYHSLRQLIFYDQHEDAMQNKHKYVMPDVKDLDQLKAESEHYDPFCEACHVDKIEPSGNYLTMDLHCVKYWTDDWSCESPPPDWAVQPDQSQQPTNNDAETSPPVIPS